MKFNDDHYTLSSGRRLPANCGLLSLDEDGDLFDGYDSNPSLFAKDAGSSRPEPGNGTRDYDDVPLTPAERAEIAEFMIARWRAFAERK